MSRNIIIAIVVAVAAIGAAIWLATMAFDAGSTRVQNPGARDARDGQ